MTGRFARILRHTFAHWGWRRRWFPDAVLAQIRDAITHGEREHAGEIVFAIEGRLPVTALVAGVTADERAASAFGTLRVWDTHDNSGVLIYVLLADQRVVVLADRGIHARVGSEAWRKVCEGVAAGFSARDPLRSVMAAVHDLHALLRREFPAAPDNPRELSDEPILL